MLLRHAGSRPISAVQGLQHTAGTGRRSQSAAPSVAQAQQNCSECMPKRWRKAALQSIEINNAHAVPRELAAARSSDRRLQIASIAFQRRYARRDHFRVRLSGRPVPPRNSLPVAQPICVHGVPARLRRSNWCMPLRNALEPAVICNMRMPCACGHQSPASKPGSLVQITERACPLACPTPSETRMRTAATAAGWQPCSEGSGTPVTRSSVRLSMPEREREGGGG
jgi:hypothetical protein